MSANNNPLEKEEIKSEQRQEDIEERMFDIAFRHEGAEYKGWAKASKKQSDGNHPASYHVVLNGVLFGNLSYHDDHWEVDDQREEGLTQKVGRQIDEYLNSHR